MLDLHRLRALLAVREHGGFVAAARALSVSPTEVADLVGGLERQLGRPLVDGEPRGGRLTPAGHQLAEHAQRLLGELEAVEADLATASGRIAGLVRIGVTPAAARALLPEALARLRETAPDVDVRIEQLTTDEGLAGIAASTLDVAIVGEYGLVPRQLDAALERRELLVEPMLVAVPVRHPAPGPTVRLADLGGDRWIGAAVDSPALELLHRGCGVAGVQPQVVAHCADDALALTLVAAGMALALVPASAADQHGGPDRRLDGVRLLTPVDPSLRRAVVAVVRRTATADPAIGRLLEALAAAGRRFVDVTPGASRPAPAGIAPEPPARPADRNGHPAILPPPLAAMERRPAPPPELPQRPTVGRSTGTDLFRGPANGLDAGVRPPGPADLPRPLGDLDRLPPPGPPGPPGLPGPADLPRPLGDVDRPALANGLPSPADLPGRRSELDRPGPANGLPGPANGLPGPIDLPRRPADPSDLPGVGPGDGPPRPRGELRHRSGPAELPEIRPSSADLPPSAPTALPPPGELPRRRANSGGTPAGGSLFRSSRPEPPDSMPTSSDLGARSLPAADLPTPRPPSDLPRRPSSGPPGRRPGGSEGPRAAGTGPSSIPRRSRAESRGLSRGSDGPDGPMGTLPPAPDQDVRLSIFEELQSEWFSRRRREDPLGVSNEPAPWDSPADDGWRAAARLSTPKTAGTTTSGLPKRVPQALYVPGAVAGEPPRPVNGAANRSAQEVRGRLSSYRDGVRRGRHAERPPTDDQEH